jgi:hypothetical protein
MALYSGSVTNDFNIIYSTVGSIGRVALAACLAAAWKVLSSWAVF